MKQTIFVYILSLLMFSGVVVETPRAQEQEKDAQEDAQEPAAVKIYPDNMFVTGGLSFYQWGKVLKKYVNSEGLADYAKMKKERWSFDPLIHNIKGADITSLTPDEQKAFWINTYNAVTLWVVRNKYPVKSIRKIDFGLVWKKGREVAGRKVSLGHIEHKILRPLGDPRVHFALNCASIGCPKLPLEPFYPERLDEQLDEAAKDFINNSDKVRLDRDTNTLYYSAIFDWFKEDFLKVAPDILSYIRKYLNEEDKAYFDNHTVEMKVLKYDWGLNDQK